MVKRPPGHSLPELIVTLVFLGAAIPAVGVAATLAARWTAGAVAGQEALRLAAQTLDSVAAAPAPTSGSRAVGASRVYWWVGAGTDPGEIRVEVVHRSGTRLATLSGRRHPTIPRLPDVGDPAPPPTP